MPQHPFSVCVRTMFSCPLTGRILTGLLFLFTTPLVAEDSAAVPVDFGTDIRPILSDTCFRCHGPDETSRQADLRLDLRDAAIAAGAIVPGSPDASAIIARMTSDDPDLKMPPPEIGKDLSASDIEHFKRWVASGAEYSEHWAFVKPTKPDVPQVAHSEAVRNPIDNFVLRRLEAAKLSPAPPADRVTLLRRLHLDLIGLPPSPAEIDAYLADTSDDATAKVIDRLLASEHFGERWARVWLDAARYADSDGYEKDKPREVWFYRDWVIDALNADLPYDQFVIEQIAGDLLPGAGQDQRVATGFLRNSMVNEEGGADPEQFRVEGMFDRVDAIGKSILGITTQCAQCHTHKYDPLQQAEYYQLFAALNDFHEATLAVFTPDQQAKRDAIEEDVANIEQSLKASRDDWEADVRAWAKQRAESLVEWRTVVPTDRPFSGQKFRPLPDGSILSESYAPTKTTDTFKLTADIPKITALRIDVLTHPQLPRGGPGRSVFGSGALTEFEVQAGSEKVQWSRAGADVRAHRSRLPLVNRNRNAKQDDRVTGSIDFAIDGNPKTAWTTDAGPACRNRDRHAVFIPRSPIERDAPYELALTLRQLHGGWNSDDNQNYLLGRYRFSVTDDERVSTDRLPTDVEAILRRAPESWSADDLDRLFSEYRTRVDEWADANRRIDALWKSSPEPSSQLVVQQRKTPRVTRVFDRGDFLKPLQEVSVDAPGFLHEMPATDEPDRLRFAKWLASDASPTTARVIVNRIWQSYFGQGLVTTPEDFGYQSATPSHPDLLDWLACELMEHDWRLKHVHRLIVDSATYRQSSIASPSLLQRDPYNVLLARGPRFRLDAELVRDGALVAAGLLETSVGGPSVYPPAPDFLFQPPASYGPKAWPTSTGSEQYRRSLYVHRYRSVPYPVLDVFDAPKGDAACVRRARSNTPLQALVMLNEPQFVAAAQFMAARLFREGRESDADRLDYVFRLCTARHPDEVERGILLDLLKTQRERVAAGELNADALTTAVREANSEAEWTAAELAPWVVVCRTILNLDETISKE